MSDIPLSSPLEFNPMDNVLEDVLTLLVIQVGNFTTQATLFDSVENQYRMLANVVQRSNMPAQQRGIMPSVNTVIEKIQKITGRRLLDDYQQLIRPANPDGSGIDAAVATFSAGKPLKATAIGLLDDFSGVGAKQLVKTTYTQKPILINLSENRDQVQIITAILQSQPEIIMFAGGSDGGASFGVRRLIECIQMSCQMMPLDRRPLVIYAGNRFLQDDVRELLNGITTYRIAPNIQPTGAHLEIQNAIVTVSESTIDIRRDQFDGLRTLDQWTEKRVIHKPVAYGRVIQFLSKARSPEKGVLGIDLDRSALTLASAHDGVLKLSVHPELSIPNATKQIIDNPKLITQLLQWLPVEIYPEDVLIYLLNKQNMPASLPSSPEEEMIETAYARIVLQMASSYLENDLLTPPGGKISGQPAQFEPILVSGDMISNYSGLDTSLLTLLDGLQPSGVTTFVLDQHNLISALGAVAEISPTATVQVLNSNAFTHLGTVISPAGTASPDTPILRARLVDENGYRSIIELKQGMLDWIPLEKGRTARIRLDPLQNFDIGMGGPGIGGSLLVRGGSYGIIFDGRGRPIKLDPDPVNRRQMHENWIQALAS